MSVSWHDNGRGPRVVLEMFGEEFVISVTKARGLHEDLTRVLEEINKAARASLPEAP